MIKLFVLDLDGCVSMPFELPDWPSLTLIRELNLKSKNHNFIPPITICSGRPLPYVEAVGQWMGIYKPLVFESGGGIYDTDSNEIFWSPEFNADAKRKIQGLREWVKKEIIKQFPGTVTEFTKLSDVGIIHKDEAVIIQIYDRLCDIVAQQFPGLEVHRTEISVNCILSGANKGNGLKRLSGLTKIELHEMAYIGDSSGDIPALNVAGMGFSPSNATAAVHKVSKRMRGKATLGVLEAYHHIIRHNRKL